MKSVIPVLGLLISLSVNCSAQTSPRLMAVSVSNCERDCYILADLTSIILKGDTLEIEAGVNLNCGGDFLGSFDYWDSDTLNLIIPRKPSENGIVAHMSCNCYYEIAYKIVNISQMPTEVLINGKTFKENRRDAGWASAE